MVNDPSLASSAETGTLGVYQLKRIWSRAMAARQGRASGTAAEKRAEQTVLYALGVGLEQTMEYLLQTAPSFEEFERWIVATAGPIPPEQVARINAAVAGEPLPPATQRWLAEIDAMPPVLTAADLAHWEEHGYVIVPEAVPEESRAAAERAIWAHLGARPDEPESWYVPNDHGIMVQFFQHPAFLANRRSRRIHKAYAQLWGTPDLWHSTDRVGFNVPERAGWMFRGPDLHWDVSVVLPMPFGTQGILYLTDTPEEQGAFTCVPGFQHQLEAWLASLPAGANPREQDLHALGSKPIAGRAGDLVIWNNALPHGSRPNRGPRPRIVQYVNYAPFAPAVQEAWR